MAAGLIVLLIEDITWFLVGLSLIVSGNGLFKPNISTMIGKLYAPDDIRRDSGFTIFYMGINLGAMIAPIITASWIGATWGLKWGFFAAGIGMILSTLFLEVAKKSLGHVGLPEKGKEGWGRFFAVGAAAMVLAGIVYFLLSESTILGYSAGCHHAGSYRLFCRGRHQVQEQGAAASLHGHDHPVCCQRLFLGLV